MQTVTQSACTVNADIRVRVGISPGQMQTLFQRLVVLFPELEALRNQRRLQMIRTGTELRIHPLKGAVLPTCLNATLLERMIRRIQVESPDVEVMR